MSKRAEDLNRLSADLMALEAAGLDDQLLSRLRVDEELRGRLRSFLVDNAAIEKLPEHELPILKTLGDNHFGTRAWSKMYWDFLSRDELANFPEFPWPLSLLSEPCPFNEGKTVRETHIVFLTRSMVGGEPATLRRIVKQVRRSQPGALYFNNNLPWRESADDTLAVETFDYRWHLAVREAVLKSEVLTKDRIDHLDDLLPEYALMPASTAIFSATANRHLNYKTTPWGPRWYEGAGLTSSRYHPRDELEGFWGFGVICEGEQGMFHLKAFNYLGRSLHNLGLLVERRLPDA